ncbi:MAG TPA: DNA gyrase inhibitor YacG [Comamonadaceae bacterium]|nr:MAG: DNA gyrase inhibitor YacG [Burkholderiales bacterium RIFCSPLOWO2_12_FULL_65_40]HCE28164.1 DNA gyrase inhibitor YacG [Comamonadaceae bacterium]
MSDTVRPSASARQVACPACRGPSLYSPQNPWRPFCSERCKQMDLGAWASENFRVPTNAPPEDATFGDPRTSIN